MPLSPQQKKTLKQQGHHLKPVVWIGSAGLSEAVLNELNTALDHHELLKVKVGEGERDERRAIIEAACETLKAELVQRVGNTAVIYRRNPKKKPATRGSI